jgi:DNA-directed RNA polymerase subunit RPC12/RpoP
MGCVHCGEELTEDPVDTTFCNYKSPRYSKGTHTGNIYECNNCEHLTIELIQEGDKLESWSY